MVQGYGKNDNEEMEVDIIFCVSLTLQIPSSQLPTVVFLAWSPLKIFNFYIYISTRVIHVQVLSRQLPLDILEAASLIFL